MDKLTPEKLIKYGVILLCVALLTQCNISIKLNVGDSSNKEKLELEQTGQGKTSSEGDNHVER